MPSLPLHVARILNVTQTVNRFTLVQFVFVYNDRYGPMSCGTEIQWEIRIPSEQASGDGGKEEHPGTT